MFGNMMSAAQVAQMVEISAFRISPWRAERFSMAHYTLHPIRTFTVDQSGINTLKWQKSGNDSLVLEGNEYVIVEVDTVISLPKGIVGRFVAGSTLIDIGVGLTVGKIEFPYGQRGEPIRFGMFNLRPHSVTIPSDAKIVAVEFFDLRGIPHGNHEHSEAELKIWSARKWRANDDGPNYE